MGGEGKEEKGRGKLVGKCGAERSASALPSAECGHFAGQKVANYQTATSC